MRIYKDRFYVVYRYRGISGFQDGTRDYCVVTGHKAKNNRSTVLGELLPIAEDVYRVEDGHLPDYQPRLRGPAALSWLRENPYSAIVRLDPATRTNDARPFFQA